MSLELVKSIAKKKGLSNWDTLKYSKAKGKRFSIESPDGKLINFGLENPKKGTFLDHGDKTIQKNWKARHSKITLKDGSLAYKNKESPAYYSYHLLW